MTTKGTDPFPLCPEYDSFPPCSEYRERESTRENKMENEGLVAAWHVASELFSDLPCNLTQARRVLTILGEMVSFRDSAGGYADGSNYFTTD